MHRQTGREGGRQGKRENKRESQKKRSYARRNTTHTHMHSAAAHLELCTPTQMRVRACERGQAHKVMCCCFAHRRRRGYILSQDFEDTAHGVCLLVLACRYREERKKGLERKDEGIMFSAQNTDQQKCQYGRQWRGREREKEREKEREREIQRESRMPCSPFLSKVSAV